MSSRVPHSERVKRGSPKNISDLPEKVQLVLKKLVEEYGEVLLLGSYSKGKWAEDSDVDVGLKNFDMKNHGLILSKFEESFGIKVDALSWDYAKTHKNALLIDEDLKDLKEINNGKMD